jgi:hypothetical protein
VVESALDLLDTVLEWLADVEPEVWAALGSLLSGVGSVLTGLVALRLAQRHTKNDAS